MICFQKIERMKGELHLLDAHSNQKNKHTFFVDSKKEGTCKCFDGTDILFFIDLLKPEGYNASFCCSVQSFNLANHLNTVPELVDRVFNRPTLKTLETKTIQGATDPHTVEVCVFKVCTSFVV